MYEFSLWMYEFLISEIFFSIVSVVVNPKVQGAYGFLVFSQKNFKLTQIEILWLFLKSSYRGS